MPLTRLRHEGAGFQSQAAVNGDVSDHDPDARCSSEKSFSLAIVGGGIGGLCLAVALVHHNVPIHVYEAAPAFAEIGAGVGLGPNALRAMALMDPAILQGYKRCETTNISEAEKGRFFNFRYGMEGPSREGMRAGDLICDVRSGGVTSSVHRARFLNELVNLMPDGVASFSKKLIGVDDGGEGVLLKFADGTVARHDAVIGCDGIKSQVRKILLGEGNKACEPVFSGHYCYRGLVPAEKAIQILGEEMALESQMCKCLKSLSRVILTLAIQTWDFTVMCSRRPSSKERPSTWLVTAPS